MAEILIMEDDAIFADLVAISLQAAGHSTTVAATGQEALETVRTRRMDLAIVDIFIRVDGFLTRDGGLLFLTRLRQQPPSAPFATLSSIPVIAMSGAVHHVGQEALLVTAGQFGANEVLAKPFRPDALLAAVGRLLPD